MKGPITRMNEATESAARELRVTFDRIEAVAALGMIAFGLVAVVAVTALLLAATAVEAR